MQFLKISGIIFFGVLGITGIVQRGVSGGENNIYFGITCLIIASILFLSLLQKGNKKYHLDKHVNSKPIYKKDSILQMHFNAEKMGSSEQASSVPSNQITQTTPSELDEFSIYSTTLFLNAYKKGSPIMDDNAYWSYFRYECGIAHPSAFHRSLIEQGYFEKPDLQEYLSSWTTDKLKVLLDSLGLKKSGRKAELISRIIDNVSDFDKSALLENIDIYVLSSKGKNFLDEHLDFVQFKRQQDGSISFRNYISMKKQLPFKASFHDVMWAIYDKRQLEYSHNAEYDKLSYAYNEMGKILAAEDRKDEALYYYILNYSPQSGENS